MNKWDASSTLSAFKKGPGEKTTEKKLLTEKNTKDEKMVEFQKKVKKEKNDQTTEPKL